MDYTAIKDQMRSCPELLGIDESLTAILFWRGDVQTLPFGKPVYSENTPLDDTFCVLLSGSLEVEKNGAPVGEISGPQVFGEMAYFTSSHARTATVRAGSDKTTIFKIQLTQEELASPKFAPLRKYLGREAWDRFVTSSQAL